MRPLRIRLEEARKRTGLPWEILEKDYILIPAQKVLCARGGLRKCR